MQTKKQSLLESLTNVVIGYGISLLSITILFPLLGIESSTSKNLLITGYFTVLSIVRSYLLRRLFNKTTNKQMKILTDKQLKELGFTLLPKVTEECDDGFAYRVAEIKGKESLIEIVNEYKDNKITGQHCNYEILEDGIDVINVELIKSLKKLIL